MLTLLSPLASLTSGAPSASTVGLDTTYSVGAQPTKVSGAGAVPLPTLPVPANYPALDVSPPIDSPEVKGWLASVSGLLTVKSAVFTTLTILD